MRFPYINSSFFAVSAPYWLWGLLVIAPLLLVGQDRYQKATWELGPTVTSTDIEQFLEQQYPMIRQLDTRLELERDRQSPGGRHLYFRQTYLGLPIYQAGISINLNQQGRTTSVLPALVSFPSRPVESFRWDSTGLAARMGETVAARRIYVSAQYYLQDGALIPIYRLETESLGSVPSYEVLVDGRTGAELQRQSLSAFFRPHGTTSNDTIGYGRVFQPDPLTRAEVAYGVLFDDNNDQHSPELEALMDTVVLRDLTYENGLFKLEGPYVRLVDRANFTIAPVTSTDGNFFFTRDASGFEDVMVYYHIDRFHRYVLELGFTNLQLNGNPIQADAHGQGNDDQSSFTHNNGNPYLLFGDGGVDDAEDADVIVHEYTHALTNAATPAANTGGGERRGLDEGVADYFTAVYSLQTSDFDAQNIFNWDGHNEFWAGRIVNSTVTYPPASTGLYSYAEIWSATLLQIREAIGDTITDRLVLQTFYSHAAGITLRDAARILLDADSLLYGGVHTPDITFYLCERNLLNSSECLQVSVTPDIQVQWNLYPNPNPGRFALAWERNGFVTAEVSVFSLLGQTVYERSVEPGIHQLQLSVPPGIYLVQLAFADGQRKVQRIMIQPE